jgi:RNA polymerase sigma-70 factor (ECF subfamily)
MNSNAYQVRRPIPSLERDDSAAKFTGASAWRGKTPRAHLESIIDKGGDTSYCSIASDDHLITTAQSGDKQAFSELCRRHSPEVKKRILSIVRNQEDAEDALQETMLRGYMHLNTFRRACKFSTWLTRIGINAALMILRKRKMRRETDAEHLSDESKPGEVIEFVDPSPDPEGLYSRHQMILVVRREMQKLRPTLRSIIEQHYGTECSVQESAKALAIPVSTAKARLLRGRKRLRWCLQRRGVSDSGV